MTEAEVSWRPERTDADADSLPRAATDVLLIGGTGRSGSTVLNMMLGQVPGFVAVGELRQVWRGGCIENQPCSCGAPFQDCDFWKTVGAEAFGGWSRVDVGAMLRTRYRLDRPWGIPLMGVAGLSRDLDRQLSDYLEVLGRLYRGISIASGAKIVVDSSKMPSHAWMVRRTPDVNLRLVHLVRDSRAVAFSAQRVVKMPGTTGSPTYLPRYSTSSASLRYLMYNALTRRLATKGTPYAFVRYEDLVAEPSSMLQRLVRHADPSRIDEPIPFLRNGEVTIAPNHLLDGNPVRFANGTLKLRLDDEWQRRMQRKDRLVATMVTLPQLIRYGYPLGR